ncbi:MAG: PAS domain-containing protein [Alphaproteobacteria bacterium]|nr:PAS domain-containing protein [Alphaproteobacteria bacterium]MBU0797471.1 PAS domain-containing protein [Alphaproteobacteria bacterium]MBU0889220.1 PAS domain-containing protein [Alphaproteobacteria bacterium]MBU1813809.1 PAS domain-containing protein [Alphaproteobacteria bacterium]
MSLQDPVSPTASAPPELLRLHEYWRGRCAQADVPDRGDIDPVDMAFCLPHLAVIELEPDPFRPRYRLVGSRLVDLFGRELTGCYVDEVYRGSVRKEALAAYRQTAEGRQPLYSRRTLHGLFRSYSYDRLMLPLRRGGDRIEQILLGLYPTDRQLVTAEQWRVEEDVRNFTTL